MVVATTEEFNGASLDDDGDSLCSKKSIILSKDYQSAASFGFEFGWLPTKIIAKIIANIEMARYALSL